MTEVTQGRVALIVGSEFGCGKTVFMCGLAGALREEGFSTRVVRPLVLKTNKNVESESAFLSTVGQTPLHSPITLPEGLLSSGESNWQDTVFVTENVTQLTLVEMPGGAASPVCFEGTNKRTISNQWRDCADLSAELMQPCIVIAKHQFDSIERLITTCSYLQARGLEVIATATVETDPDAGATLERQSTRADFSLGLNERTGIPFLGCIKFSPSISVHRVCQGNLIKMTETGLDLLPLMKALNLTVPVRL